MALAALKSQGLEFVRKAPGGAVIAFFLLSGLFKLVPVVFPDILPLDSDEAVLGLMARHIAHGELPRFAYGQTYGGGFEVLLAAGLDRILPSGIYVFRLAAALLAFATEWLFYRALAATFSSRTTRIAAAAMLAVGGMTYSRFMSHLYGIHLNNCFIFATLLFWSRDLRTLQRRAFLVGLWIGVGYWVSPFVWLSVVCILAIRMRQWNDVRKISLGQLLLLIVGFAAGALPRIIHSYSPESWYAPYRAGGFALAHISAIPRRTTDLVLMTLPQYFFGELSTLGVAGSVAIVLGTGVSVFLLLQALLSTARAWHQGQRTAFVPASVFLLAAASAVLVVLNRRVFDSGYRYLWPVQFALAAAWAAAIDRFVQARPPHPGKPAEAAVTRAFRFTCASLPFVLGAASLSIAQLDESRVHAPAAKRTIAVQALSDGCRVGVADYWYAYSLSLLTQEQLRLAPIYTPRIPSYAQAAADAIAAGTRYCAIFDLSDSAQSTLPNRRLYQQLLPKAERVHRYPGSIVLLVLGSAATEGG
jgi:hypothetical protein